MPEGQLARGIEVCPATLCGMAHVQIGTQPLHIVGRGPDGCCRLAHWLLAVRQETSDRKSNETHRQE